MHIRANKGIFLVITLLFVMALTGVSVLLAKISTENQRILQVNNNNINLANQAKVSNKIMERSMDRIFLANLDVVSTTPSGSSKANVYYVNSSGATGTAVTVFASTNPNNIVDIKARIVSATGVNNANLIADPTIVGNFNIDLVGIDRQSNTSSTIIYKIKYSSKICNSKEECNIKDSITTKTRSCPAPNNQTTATMRAMLPSELPAGTPYNIGDIYCTCSQGRTDANGNCITCNVANCSSCSSSDPNVCTACNQGYNLTVAGDCV